MQRKPNNQKATESAALAWLEGLRLGDLRRHHGLAVVAVYQDVPAPPVAYATLAEAVAHGEAVVTEQPQASVPTLQVQNRGEIPVLILDGEEVVGGKQNRVVNTTLLVPARTVFDLPVSCVEHGRWNEAAPTFLTGEAAYPTLRRQKMAQVAAALVAEGAPRSDQGAIWDEIAARHGRDRVASPTGAMRDAYRRRDEELASAQQALPCPTDNAMGVVALVGGRAHCADLFDRPTTLRAYWPRLVRSYALEASDAPSAEPSLGSARRLLGRPLAARRTVHPSPGLGLDVRFAGGGVVGAALVLEATVVHAALFRQRQATAETPSIRRPSQRARWYADR